MSDYVRPLLVPIHREGWRFIALFAVGTAFLFWLWDPLGWIGAVLTAWCAWFFRDPDRVTPTRAAPGLVIAPADGYVQTIVDAPAPAELGMGAQPRPRISIFMNAFDIHVNRNPVDGTVTATHYRPGAFLNAELDKASEDNERMAIRYRADFGRDIVCVQIAGFVARRILCELHAEDKVAAGARFGMIRFGSRVDVYLEPGMVPLVAIGQTTVAGETVLADAQSSEPKRGGESR
ncbi:MAG: phosphatidylserine decarboxylase [Alphaproteobacteria bacterium]|nr:phosphatidylserine decarboxylase [Alphaproteobacteria bacterium]